MNARQEFIEHVNRALGYIGRGEHDVKCASVSYESIFDDETQVASLPVDWSEDEFDFFLKKLNFNYNDGFGVQEVYGIIWYTDGSWSTREEYDGSEWWVHNILPDIPKRLLK